jgi:hypothetical protein
MWAQPRATAMGEQLTKCEIDFLSRSPNPCMAHAPSDGDNYQITGSLTRRRFTLGQRPATREQQAETGRTIFHFIQEVPVDCDLPKIVWSDGAEPQVTGHAAAEASAQAGLPDLPNAVCANCRKPPASPGATLKFCSVCKGPRYCSAKCQKAHWKAGHKQECAIGNSKVKKT